MEVINEIAANLCANKTRTYLTGISIAWGIFMLVALLACGNGIRNGAENNFNYMNKNTISLYTGRTSIPYNGIKEGRLIQFTPADIEYLRNNLPNCTDFAPIYNLWSSSIIYNKLEINATTTGVEPDYANIRTFNIESGRFINEIDMTKRRKAVVIPTDVCNKYFKNYEEAIGKTILLANNITFTIIGVYSEKGASWQPSVYIPLTTANCIYNPSGNVEDISFGIKDITSKEETELYSAQLRTMLASHFNFSPEDHSAIWINNRISDMKNVQTIFTGISVFIWMIGISTLISGIVGVCNIMIVSVRERTKEIGIRKAIGASPRSILSMIITESITMTTIFGYIGLLLGVGLSEILCMIFPEPTVTNQMTPQMFVNPTVDLNIIFAATLILIIAGVVAGYIPAKRAIKIKAIEAMNTK